MTLTDAYLQGFKKAASAAGVDPNALMKVAFLGAVRAGWNAVKATGTAAKAVAPAARNAWNAAKRTKDLQKATTAATDAWKAVPGVQKATKAVKTVAKMPGVKTTAKYGLPSLAAFGIGRASASGDGDASEQSQEQNQASNAYPGMFMPQNPDVLGQFRTASDENLQRVFNFRPYVPRWEQQLLAANNGYYA